VIPACLTTRAPAAFAIHGAATPIKTPIRRALIARPARCLFRKHAPEFGDRMPPMAVGSKQVQAVLAAAGFRAGIVIAATPATTQARPAHAVGDRVSPRKMTLSATPIGTRK